MSRYAVAHLDEIDEISDGRCPSRPIRYHFGITSFGVNAWTGREAGDRIINEHDEGDDGDEELYLVQRGRARFELDGEPVQAPVGTLVFVRPAVKRTAFAEEPGTTARSTDHPSKSTSHEALQRPCAIPPQPIPCREKALHRP